MSLLQTQWDSSAGQIYYRLQVYAISLLPSKELHSQLSSTSVDVDICTAFSLNCACALKLHDTCDMFFILSSVDFTTVRSSDAAINLADCDFFKSCRAQQFILAFRSELPPLKLNIVALSSAHSACTLYHSKKTRRICS